MDISEQQQGAQTKETPAPGQEQPVSMPRLRLELQLNRGAALQDGSPGWMLFDPVRHKYFQLNQDDITLLKYWSLGDPATIAQRAGQDIGRPVQIEEIEDFFKFLLSNGLTEDSAQGSYKDFYEQHQAGQQSWHQKLLHSYLFFRIPMVHPEKFLKRTLPTFEFLFSKAMLVMVAVLTLVGLYFVGRQWDEFTNTFLFFFSLEGAMYYAISLIFVKIAHELGHAYMATRYGCRVPTMGVAVLLMMPLLYTDVTDAWRLKEKRKRLMIDAGGMFVELYIAGIATFLWAFLPDGSLRSIAFIVGTTSWIMSILVNLNMFMKFDGYYIFSDALGVPNLQERSFALGRWKMRELLFGIKSPIPEVFSDRMRRTLISFAWGVWIYRFFLFLGIAFLIYSFAFKVLGIFLFAVEIIWFLAMPVYKELKEWWSLRTIIMKTNRTKITAALTVMMVALFVTPWSSKVKVPAIITAENQSSIHPLADGQIVKIHITEGQQVRQGQILLELRSPLLSFQIQQSKKHIALLKTLLGRRSADKTDRANSLVLTQELGAEQDKLLGMKKQLSDLTIRAPFDGHIRDLEPTLHEDEWINTSLQLATLVAPGKQVVRGYVSEQNLWRLKEGNAGKFIPEDPARPTFEVQLHSIDAIGTTKLEDDYLSSSYGGDIAVQKKEDEGNHTVTGQYRLVMSAKDNSKVSALSSTLRGSVHLYGQSESMASAIARQVMSVLIRESGV